MPLNYKDQRANFKAEQWKKRDQKAQKIPSSDGAAFKNPYLNLGRTDTSAKKDTKKEPQKARDADPTPIMFVQRSNLRSQQVEEEVHKHEPVAVGMVHTPRKARPPE